ncbi:MAG: hypothetical protein IT318_09015 [Anaerolineales bacterium]|nr:hypothetical protein [Anaerolineales bacterium]
MISRTGHNTSQRTSTVPNGGSIILSKRLYQLTIGGGLVFWATTIATSLLPIAAEYRASFLYRSWSIQTVWIGALPAGIIIGGCVSYFCLRWLDKDSTKKPIQVSLILSFLVLAMATILIDVTRSLYGPADAWYYFLIGIMLNVPRFVLLGLAIGYLYRRLDESA